jgi:hypothetical protein
MKQANSFSKLKRLEQMLMHRERKQKLISSRRLSIKQKQHLKNSRIN